jgi:hypothetical protein
MPSISALQEGTLSRALPLFGLLRPRSGFSPGFRDVVERLWISMDNINGAPRPSLCMETNVLLRASEI